MTHRFDFLVIGSGIAGLTYALRVAVQGTVAVITKKERAESNTNYAQGGVAAVVGPDDSADLHIADTLATGVGLCRPEAVRVMVEEGPPRVRELMSMGAEFTEKEGALDLSREGGHSRNRIVHAKDLTGREIERSLLARISGNPNIVVFENHIAVDLITQHQATGWDMRGSLRTHCWGAYALNVEANRVEKFLAPAVILCTGGVGQAYLHTTNPPIATGDGVAMASRAGARIVNMEFIQFHPTTLYNSGSPSFLITEAVRGAGAVLRTISGEEFMHRYDSRKSLAPRDIVAFAIDNELKKRGEDHVLLDLSSLSAEGVRERFPHIYNTCLTKYRLDITRGPIPVVPAAHYSCGGVDTDLHGRTSIAGLYAAGEVSMTGVHGANRLASNSLLEALVFSARAAASSVGDTKNVGQAIPEIREWDDTKTFNSEEWVLVSHDRREIQQIMWDYVGIVRSNLRIQRAYDRIALVRKEVEAFYKRTKVSEGLLELRNLACCASIIIQSSQKRKESRGLFVNTDYPSRNDELFRCETVLD